MRHKRQAIGQISQIRLAATQAGRNKRFLWLDPTLLVGGLGPSLPDGLAVLSSALYPAAQPLTAQGPQ